MVALSHEDIGKAFTEAQSLGLTSRAALLKLAVDGNTLLWGEDLREYTEAEARVVLAKLRLPDGPTVQIEPEIFLPD